MRRGRRFAGAEGFTLTELMVVVVIIGLMAAFAVPSYMRSVEMGKADEAVAVLSMVAATNRMFAMNHGNQYATGSFPANICSINPPPCPAVGPWSACDLVFCGYLSDQDWGKFPYQVAAAGSASANAACPIAGTGGANAVVSCVKRKTGSTPGTSNTPYMNWWYSTNALGTISRQASAPPPS